MKAEQRIQYKQQWEACSPQARKITKALKAGDYLKLPEKMRGWGLAGWLLVYVAEAIDKEVQDE